MRPQASPAFCKVYHHLQEKILQDEPKLLQGALYNLTRTRRCSTLLIFSFLSFLQAALRCSLSIGQCSEGYPSKQQLRQFPAKPQLVSAWAPRSSCKRHHCHRSSRSCIPDSCSIFATSIIKSQLDCEVDLQLLLRCKIAGTAYI